MGSFCHLAVIALIGPQTASVPQAFVRQRLIELPNRQTSSHLWLRLVLPVSRCAHVSVSRPHAYEGELLIRPMGKNTGSVLLMNELPARGVRS